MPRLSALCKHFRMSTLSCLIRHRQVLKVLIISAFSETVIYEDLDALLIPPGPRMSTGAEIGWICFRMYSANQRTRMSMGLGWSYGGQPDKIVFSDAWLFSCLLMYHPVSNRSACVHDLFEDYWIWGGHEDTIDTVRTLDVRQHCDKLNMFTDVFGES